ncbi:MAG: 50S ribosomal protein L28 [Candidatus Saccharibacteria bacterium]
MSYKCDITGKGKQFGNNRSHSLRATPKAWKPNLQMKTLVIDGQKVRLKLAASTIRTLRKYETQLSAKELAAATQESTKK